MNLIIKKSTGHIENEMYLITGDYTSLHMLNVLKNSTGEVIIPEGWQMLEVPDNSYDFSADETIYGHTNTYYYINGQIVLKRILEPEFVRQQIGWLEDELKSTDYKVIKAYEASLIGGEVPYDFSQVHADRQAIRDKVNELEALLNQEGGVM